MLSIYATIHVKLVEFILGG